MSQEEKAWASKLDRGLRDECWTGIVGGVLLAVAVHPFRVGYFNFFTGGCRTRNEQSISEMVCLDTAVESGGSETGSSDTGDVWGLRWPASGGKSFSSRMESLLNS